MADNQQQRGHGPGYPNYVLFVLVLVYVFNFLDRQILSILNDHIKADLGLTDAQMGFLYGTVFAVFYALFGIPLGRLADVWDRRKLIAVGLGFWSLMTAVSGLARNFGQLAAARIGVGVGEASASPAAYSMLSDYFPAARRATVLAIYSSGIYIGAGAGLMIGGQIVDRWDLAFAGDPTPFGLRGWQVAFFVVGLPGLLLALWVSTLHEPERGQAEGIVAPQEPHPFHEFFRELRAVVPPLTLWHLRASGAGRKVVVNNLLAALLLAAAAYVLIRFTDDMAQWVALAVGLYSAVSWTQAVTLRDRPSAELILHTASLRWSCLGFSFLAFTGYGIGYWTPPFLLRFHGASTADVGLIAGGTSAAAGWMGVTLGGLLADRLRARVVNGRLHVGMLTAVATLPLALWMLATPSLLFAYILNFPVTMFSSMWIGAGASTVQDLVLPRMRAVASAAYLLVVTFIGLALGPYMIGKLSVVTGSLQSGMMVGLCANVVALVCLLLAARHLESDEASMRRRAGAAGESISDQRPG
jgi:MFS family permease